MYKAVVPNLSDLALQINHHYHRSIHFVVYFNHLFNIDLTLHLHNFFSLIITFNYLICYFFVALFTQLLLLLLLATENITVNYLLC